MRVGHGPADGALGNRQRLAVVLASTASALILRALVSEALALLAAAHAFVDSAELAITLVAATFARMGSFPSTTTTPADRCDDSVRRRSAAWP